MKRFGVSVYYGSGGVFYETDGDAEASPIGLDAFVDSFTTLVAAGGALRVPVVGRAAHVLMAGHIGVAIVAARDEGGGPEPVTAGLRCKLDVTLVNGGVVGVRGRFAMDGRTVTKEELAWTIGDTLGRGAPVAMPLGSRRRLVIFPGGVQRISVRPLRWLG